MPDELDLPLSAATKIATRQRIIRGASGHDRGFVFSYDALPPTSVTFESLGWAIRGFRERRALKRLIAAAGPPTSIAAAEAGVVRIAGRVEVIAAPLDRAPDVAAFFAHVAEERTCTCKPSCAVVALVVQTHAAAGRFLVRDDSGAAVVIGPRVRLIDYHGKAPDPFDGGALLVRSGDLVTVIGHATRRALPDVRPETTGGYREVRPPLVLEGAAGEPVHLFCAPTDT